MTLRPPFMGNTEFDAFLFAPICGEAADPVDEDSDEVPTTVLSALTRLNIDPWEEAARLSELPKEQAAVDLGLCIGSLPGKQQNPSEIAAIAVRLADLLPQHEAAGAPSDTAKPLYGGKSVYTTVLWVAGLAIGAIALFMLFFGQGELRNYGGLMRPPVTGPIIPGN